MKHVFWALLLGAIAVSTSPPVSAQQTQSPERRIEVLPVGGDPALGKVYLFAGTDANVVVQAGDEGAIVVDTSTGAVSELLIAEVSKLTSKPIRYVINTSAD